MPDAQQQVGINSRDSQHLVDRAARYLNRNFSSYVDTTRNEVRLMRRRARRRRNVMRRNNKDEMKMCVQKSQIAPDKNNLVLSCFWDMCYLQHFAN